MSNENSENSSGSDSDEDFLLAGFTLPVPPRSKVQYVFAVGTVALGVGVASRIAVTAANSIEEVLSVFDLVTELVSENLVVTVGLTALFSVSGYVTWQFWTPAIEESVALTVTKCTGPRRIEENSNTSDRCVPVVQCFSSVFNSLPWLGYVSVANSVATLGLASNENEEGVRMLLGISRSTWGTVIISLGLGIIATSYSAATELRMLWQDRLTGDAHNRAARHPSRVSYAIAFAGTAELAFRTWLVIYLTSLDITQERASAATIASLFTLLGTIQNFCFQAIYTLEGSPIVSRINRTLVGLPVPAKVAFLSSIGLTTVVTNMGLSSFNIHTLLLSIFRDRAGFTLTPAVAKAIAISVAVVITGGDLLSSFWDGVVKQTMGWEEGLALPVSYANGPRSPAVNYESLYRGGRFRTFPYAGSQGRVYSIDRSEQVPEEDTPLLIME